MSRVVMIGSTRDPKPGKPDPLFDLDIDELVERLTPGEIQRLLDECDPDDPHIPPSMRTNYKCQKEPTGPLDRKKLMDYINDQALNTPDLPEAVPFVSGTVRGKKYQAPPKPDPGNNSGFGGFRGGLLDEKIELDIDLGEDCELALSSASTEEIVDLAGILGLHSMMNQDQFHAAQSDKWSIRADPEVGWSGITKATKLKEFPTEEPNRTKPDEIITKLQANHPSTKTVNLNNVVVSEAQFVAMFQAMRGNETMVELSAANCGMTDAAGGHLAEAIEANRALEKLNIESNYVSPQTIVKIFEAANAQQVLKEVKASNQQAQFLGNKVEMAITHALEKNKSILKVGLHFEFGDCRNRVAVQLQKNLDRVRLKRVAHKLSNPDPPKAAGLATAPAAGKTAQNGASSQQGSTSGSRTGGYFGGLPGQLSSMPRQKSPEEDEYEDEEEEEEEEAR